MPFVARAGGGFFARAFAVRRAVCRVMLPLQIALSLIAQVTGAVVADVASLVV